MKRFRVIGAALGAAAVSAMLAACGGGGSGSPPASAAGATSLSGVITGFGSVFVGGRELATDGMTRVVDGDDDDASSSVAALQVGMLVDAQADRDGHASLLRFRSVVRGEVDAIDAGGSTLTVLGQTVGITSATSFSGSRGTGAAAAPIAQLGDIQPGDYVAVFGYLECPGTGCASGATQITATLVQEPPAAGKYLAQGYVSNLAAGGGSFSINGLTVEIATGGTAPTTCNTTGCALADGDFVVVRATAAPTGTFAATAGTLTITAARIVRRSDAPVFAAGSTVTLEGAVTQLSGSTFMVRGVSVDASDAALASAVAALANGQIVEVTGTISSSGTLVATAIDVERSATMMLMAPLDADPTSSALSVLGQVFTVDAGTRFADWAQGVRPFNAGNFATVLKAGDQVIVSGYANAGGGVATRVERIPTPATPLAAAEGIVTAEDTAASPETVTLAGVTASIGGATRLAYPGSGAMPTETGFFSAITLDSSVAWVFGTPGATQGTIAASKARVLLPAARWDAPH